MHMKLLNIKKNLPYMVVQCGHVEMAFFIFMGTSAFFFPPLVYYMILYYCTA